MFIHLIVFLVTEFEKLNPLKCVPALVDGDTLIGDSFAILLVTLQISS
jgi:glutathione S-transferase